MTTGIAAPWVLYGIKASSWGNKSIVTKFYGCAFPIDTKGNFATCKHVIPSEVKDDEILVAQHPTQDRCFKVVNIQKHLKYDFAIFHCDIQGAFGYLWVPELNLGDDVFAYGYYDYSIQNDEIIVVPQLHKGYVTATPRTNVGICDVPLPWYQLSFATPNGFSGSPLYHEAGEGCFVAGMIVESIKTEYGGIFMAFGKAISGLQIRILANELGIVCREMDN